jgi:phosphate transport system permease protein
MNSLKKKRIIDRAAHWGISFGGAAVILVILVLFIFIFMEVFPLLQGPRVLEESICSLSGEKVVSIGLDEYQEIAYAVYDDGDVDFISLPSGIQLKKHSIKSISGHSITSVCNDNDRILLGTDDGRILVVNIDFGVSFENDERTIIPEISDGKIAFVDGNGNGIKYITSKENEGVTVTAFCMEDGRLILRSTEIEETLFSSGEEVETISDITDLVRDSISDKTKDKNKKHI